MGVLPGGTGNGFARELRVPGELRAAVEVLCTSANVRAIDVARIVEVGNAAVDDAYFLQRAYIGIEPEEQTSREQKDKFGVFAYAVNMAVNTASRGPAALHEYRIEIDGETGATHGTKAYLVNSGMMGTGLRMTHTYAVDDGLLDCFIVDVHDLASLMAAAERFVGLNVSGAAKHFRQGRHVYVEADPDQAVWADGEYIGRTPLRVSVLPGGLRVVVP